MNGRGSGVIARQFSPIIRKVKYIITRNPDQDALSFDEQQWRERIQKGGSIMDVTDVSLEKFRAKGGKIILTHGNTQQNDAQAGALQQAEGSWHMQYWISPGCCSII